MPDIFVSLGSWNWLIAGLVLVGLELMVPGVFLFWLGLAAFIVGVMSFFIDWSWQSQLLTFAVLAIAAVPLWRLVQRKTAPIDNTFLNRRAEALVGRVFTLERPIVDGVGTIPVDDTLWRVKGPDAPAGSHVKVVHADGVNLTVTVV